MKKDVFRSENVLRSYLKLKKNLEMKERTKTPSY